MGLRMDVLAGLDTVLFFSFGERYIMESLEQRSPFDHDGMKLQWELFESVWNDVMEYLRFSFPALRERERGIYCQLRMCKLREMIEANERCYECYCSVVERHAA